MLPFPAGRRLATETTGCSPRFLLHYLEILRLPVSVAPGPSTLDWLVGWLSFSKSAKNWEVLESAWLPLVALSPPLPSHIGEGLWEVTEACSEHEHHTCSESEQ